MKKILAIFLAAFMVVSLLPTVAFAETKTTTVSTWEDLQTAIDGADEGDTIQLEADITALDGDSTIEIGKKLTLDLNGYMLDANWDESYIESVINLVYDADLTIIDSRPNVGTHTLYRYYGEWYASKAPEDFSEDEDRKIITITGGLITGGNAYYCYGGGIHLEAGAKCTLESGTIAGNCGEGGGVYVESEAQFIMNGGSISYNDGNWGGGVYLEPYDIEKDVDGKFSLFTMNGGSISYNVANLGGGIYVGSSRFDHSDMGYYEAPYLVITGGSIDHNEAASGGGVYLSGEGARWWWGDQHTMLAMTGGSITENICTARTGGYGGAGVCLDSEKYCYVYLGGTAVISGNTNPNMDGDNKDNNLLMKKGGYLAFGDSICDITAPASGMNVGVTLADMTGAETGIALTDKLDSIPKGILGYLYSDNTDYMVDTDNDKVVLKEAPDIIIGDADGNKRLEADDITALINELLNGTECTDVLDCNGDGAFDILDLVRLKKYFATGTPLGKTE